MVEVIVGAHSRMKKIDAAFGRMTDGTYGICPECGVEIRQSRLLAQPRAETCIGCHEHRESEMLNHLAKDFTIMLDKQMEAAWRA